MFRCIVAELKALCVFGGIGGWRRSRGNTERVIKGKRKGQLRN